VQQRLRRIAHATRSRLGLRTRYRRLTRRNRALSGEQLQARVQTYFGDPTDLAEREREIRAMIQQLERADPAGPPPTQFIRPVAGRVTCPFGERFGRTHNGVDIAGRDGQPIRAGATGRVLFAGEFREYGNTTVIGHGGGVVTIYAHQREFLCRPGDEVQCGDVIGTVGASGRVTGPHLHFELRRNGIPQDPSAQWRQ
jgi:murein DD-endopeptidase MepM/ murein hydrolase activator NlpD